MKYYLKKIHLLSFLDFQNHKIYFLWHRLKKKLYHMRTQNQFQLRFIKWIIPNVPIMIKFGIINYPNIRQTISSRYSEISLPGCSKIPTVHNLKDLNILHFKQ